jgi:hypothetical protein
MTAAPEEAEPAFRVIALNKSLRVDIAKTLVTARQARGTR